MWPDFSRALYGVEGGAVYDCGYLVNYPLVVKVAHPLSDLLSYDDHLQISGDQVIEAVQVISGEQEVVQVISDDQVT